MIDVLPVAVTIGALACALWALVLLVTDRPPRLLLALLAVVELGLLIQAVIGVVLLAGTERPVSAVSFLGYLLGALLVLPLGVVFAMGERSRWAAGVLAVASLTVPVMVLRLQQIWSGTGG